MTVRRSSIVSLMLGTLLLVGATVVRFSVVPELSKLHADFSAGQKFEGTVRMVNPQAFAMNDLANLVGPEMPVTANRSLAVDAVSGDTAIITTDTAVNLPNGLRQKDIHTFAVNRADFSPVVLTDQEVQSLVPVEARSRFTAHEGILFSFAPSPANQGNRVYDTVTMAAQDAKFTKEDTVEGRKVNRYEVNGAGSVKNPSLLVLAASLPAQVPKELLAGLLQAGVVPQQSIPALRAGLASLPEIVAVGLGSTNSMELAVDQQFGTPLDAKQTQGIYATVVIDGQRVPVLPLSVVSLHVMPTDVAATGAVLSSNATKLSLVGGWLPLFAAVLGVGFILMAAARWRRPKDNVVTNSVGNSKRRG
ncbi:porin PorA family protein [Mycobacteroides chelonae]